MVADFVKQSPEHHDITGQLQRENRLGPASKHVVGHEFDLRHLSPGAGVVETAAVVPLVFSTADAMSLAATDGCRVC